MVVSVCEQINDSFTKEIAHRQSLFDYTFDEYYRTHGTGDEYVGVFEIDKYIYNTKKSEISVFKNPFAQYDICNEDVFIYWHYVHLRKTIRIIRKLALYFYYFVITAIIVFLLLSHELTGCIDHLNLGDWTILSFVIILFEILIKNSLTDSIYHSIINSLEKRI